MRKFFDAWQVAVLLLVLAAAGGGKASMAAVIWDGSDSDAWEDPNNWVGGSLPGNGQDANIGTTAAGGELIAVVDVTTDVSLGGTVTFGTVTVGVNNNTTSGTLNVKTGATLKTNTLNIGTGGGTTGVVHLDDAGLTGMSLVTIGSAAGGIGSITRAGTTPASEIISTTNLFVYGSGTYGAATGDVISTKVHARSGGTVDLSDQTLTVPTIQFGETSSSGALTRTTGNLSVSTLLDAVGSGTSISITAADVLGGTVKVRNDAALTLGADVTTPTVIAQSGATLDMNGNNIGSSGTPITLLAFEGSTSTLTRGGGTIHAETLEIDSGATFVPDTLGGGGDTANTLLFVQHGTLSMGTQDVTTPGELRLGQSGNPAVVSRTTGNIDVGTLRVQSATTTFDFITGDTVGGEVTVLAGSTVNQNFTPQLVVGGAMSVDGAETTYNMGAGADLEVGGTLTVGSGGDVTPRAVFNFGTASGTASVSSSANNQTLRVFDGGELRGWGVIDLSNGAGGGQITQNGRVVADGFGTAAAPLDLSSFNTVANNAENGVGQDNGWFAVDQGKLILPDLAITTANAGNFTWGDSINDDTPDMINSIYFHFEDGVDGGASNAGALSISLLATDHPNVEPLLDTPLAVWEIQPDENLAFATVDLAIRYDDLLAGLEGLVEADLKLLHFVGGEWIDVTDSVDDTNKIISAVGLTSFSQFAVAAGVTAPFVPEPSTLTLLGLGAAGLLRRRSRRRFARR